MRPVVVMGSKLLHFHPLIFPWNIHQTFSSLVTIGIILSPALKNNGEINAVIIEMIPTSGNRNALTAPASTPTFMITIENSPLGAANANGIITKGLAAANKQNLVTDGT